METFFYLGVLRLTYKKQVLLCSVFDHNVATTEKEKIERQMITTAQSCSHFKQGWREKYSLNTQRSLNLFTYFDGELNCILGAVAREQVTERQASELLKAQAVYMKESIRSAQLEGGPHSLTKMCKEPFRELMKTHSKDSLRQTTDKVEGVKSQMQDNLGRMVCNLHSLEEMKGNMDDLEDGSHNFQTGTQKLQKHAKWQYYKWIIASVICFVVIVLLILPISMNGNGSSSSSNSGHR